jgi:hypothetical protein
MRTGLVVESPAYRRAGRHDLAVEDDLAAEVAAQHLDDLGEVAGEGALVA